MAKVTRKDIEVANLTGNALAIAMDALVDLGWESRCKKHKARPGSLAKKARVVVREIQSFEPKSNIPGGRHPWNGFGFMMRRNWASKIVNRKS